jgi:hypothetical protein
MAVYDDLKAYVGAPDSDNAFVATCWTEAHALVDKFCGVAGLLVVPVSVLQRAKIECGSELYHRRSAPNGIAQFATLDGGSAVRVARDPMIAAYPLLVPYVGQGIA